MTACGEPNQTAFNHNQKSFGVSFAVGPDTEDEADIVHATILVAIDRRATVVLIDSIK